MKGFAAVAAAVAALIVVSAAAASSGGFVVGFDDDLPMQDGASAVSAATSLGATAFRFTLAWAPGETALTPDDRASLGRAVSAAGGDRIVLAVYGSSGAAAPVDAAGRDAYCAYLKDAVTAFPSIHDVVVWNEPNKRLFWNPQTNAPALYEALLAQCYDVLHPLGVNVIGFAVSSTGNDDAGSTSPGAFVRGVGAAYRSSGRTTPLLDTVGFHPYPLDSAEAPGARHIGSTTIGEGDWNKLMYNLWQAFDGTGQPLPGSGGVSIWYLEDGFQTTVSAAEAANYTGTENVTTIPDVGGTPDQAAQIGAAIRLAACQPDVGAFFNFMLVDDPALAGWQSGAYWADLTPKGSWSAFQAAIGEATGGTVDCGALAGGPPSGDFMPPSVPANVSAQAQAAPLGVTVSWDAAADDSGAPLTYRVYRDGAWVGTTTALAWTNTSVTDATTYSYTVRAIDAAGNLGGASPGASVTTPDVTAPSAPSSLAAQAAATPPTVALSWEPASDNVGATAYRIARDGTEIATVAGTSYTDTAVAAGGSYDYAVTALDAAGNEGPAATVQADVPAAPAPPPAPAPVPAGGGGGGGAAAPDLGVSVAGPGTPPAVGDGIALVVSIGDRGGPAAAATLTVDLTGLEYVSSQVDRGPGCTAAGSTVSCFLDFFPSGFAAREVIFARVTALPASARASLSVSPVDANAADDAATWSVAAPAPPPAVTPPAPPKPKPLTLAVRPVRSVSLDRAAPAIAVRLRASRPVALRVSLLDRKRHVLVTWLRRLTVRTTAVNLPVPKRRRHAGRYLLRLAAGGVVRTVPVVFRS